MGELFSIPGPNDCIVTCCGELLTVLWFYAEQFVFNLCSVWLTWTLESCLAYPAYQLHSNILYLSIYLSIYISIYLSIYLLLCLKFAGRVANTVEPDETPFVASDPGLVCLC